MFAKRMSPLGAVAAFAFRTRAAEPFAALVPEVRRDG